MSHLASPSFSLGASLSPLASSAPGPDPPMPPLVVGGAALVDAGALHAVPSLSWQAQQMLHLTDHDSQLLSLTGAPSRAELLELTHLVFPRKGGIPDDVLQALSDWHPAERLEDPLVWRHKTHHPLLQVVVALAHLRQDTAYDSLAGIFGLSNKSEAWRCTKRVTKRVAFLASQPDVRGCVLYLPHATIAHQLPLRFRDTLPQLKAIIDCFPIYMQTPGVSIALAHALYDHDQHEGFHWAKMMTVVAPTGYIMGVYGPYAPASSAPDGMVLTHALLSCDRLWDFAKQGGVWLADYGFRGVEAPPEVTIHLPKKWLAKEGEQGTREELDHNTIMLAARWIVEAGNERLENMRFFSGRERPVSELSCLRSMALCAAFLFNRWNKPVLQ